MLPKPSAIVISTVVAALSLAVWAIFGVLVLIGILIVTAMFLLGCAGRFERVRPPAPYILCLMGVMFSLTYAFENARLETTRFWITLERASVMATGVLSLCYWVIEFLFPDETASRLTKRDIGFLLPIVVFGALFLILSSHLPYLLLILIAGSNQITGLTQNSIQFVYLQQLFIVCGSLLFALNSGIVLRKTHLKADTIGHDDFLLEKHKAWILFFCSDLITALGFVILVVYLTYFLGWDFILKVLQTPQQAVAGSNPTLIEGAVAFFTGAVTFQIIFSNGVFYFVNLPWKR